MRADVDSLSEVEREVLVSTWKREQRTVLPAEWRCGEVFMQGAWYRSTDGLRALVVVEFIDGAVWLHVSFSRHDRVPSYFDTKRIKQLFFGPDRKAIMVFPSDAEHYNHHPNCLHLYAGPAAEALPDFRDSEGRL